MDRRLRGLLFASTTALIWGLQAIVLKYALRITTVETVVWFRFASASLMLGLLLRARRPAALGLLRRPPWVALLSAALLAANYRFFYRGLELNGASGAQVLIQTSPLLFAVIGIVLFREKVRPAQRAGFLLAVAGFALFYRDQVSLGDAHAHGVLVIAVAAVTWAAWATLNKMLILRGSDPQGLNLVSYLVGMLLLSPWADVGGLGGVSAGDWGVLLLLGLSTVLAYGTLGEAMRDAPANQVSMILTLNPIVTIAGIALVAALRPGFLSPEPIAPLGYAGAGLLLLGVGLVVGRRRAPSR